MLLRLTGFKGMAPSVSATMLPDQAAQVATNCRLNMGDIRPIKGMGAGAAHSKVGTVLSIYPYASKWFNWLSDVNCVKSPIAQDAWDRRYWTGDGAPKMTVSGIATSSSDYPSASYNLGLPVPANTPTVEASGTITDPDPTLVESRQYVYTYVSAYGEEGPSSAPSAMVDVAPGQGVDLTNLSVAPTGSYNITHKRIYRTNTGSTSTEYQLVATIAVATATYSDVTASSDLGEVLMSSAWIAPPATLSGLTATPSGSLIGFYNNVFCESVPWMPHAWPAEYQVPLDATIVAVGSYGNNVLVVTTGAPYISAGAAGSRQMEKLEQGYACISKRGFVDMGYSCIYPAINGLMMAGMQGVQLATQGILTQADWQALSPSTIHAYLHDGKYIAFWTNSVSSGFVFDPVTGDFTLHDIPATAGYHNPATGALHIVSDGQIRQWEGGSSNLSVTWKSKVFTMPFPHSLACAQVLASAYPVTLTVYADGVLRDSRTVQDKQPFRLSGGVKADVYEFEISGVNVVTAMHVASTMQELGQI